jgi:membrane-associated phospholipid phosphatase
VLQLALLVLTAPAYAAHGLSVDWPSTAPQMLAQAVLAGLWLYFRRYTAHRTKYLIPDVVLVTALLVLLTNIVSPAQYVAIALNRPLIDPALARADALLGVHVPTLAHWTAGHPRLSLLLTLCYVSFLPQILLPILIVGLHERNREHLWEFAFHFHFCLIVTLAALALFPAACAFQYYGFHSTLDQTRFIGQFNGVRAGTFHVIRFNELEGLISMPSFHVAGGLMVTWAFRKYRWLLVGLVLLNAGMIASTFLSGAHYFVDVLASALLFVASVIAYRCLAVRLIARGTRGC